MRALAFRLSPGVDLRDELERLAQAEGLRAGAILTGVGSLARARLRMPGARAKPPSFATSKAPRRSSP